jgi:hypothetical protein
MRLGFDAKRAFFNSSGLGNYSRGIIKTLADFYPNNQYFLYTPAYPGRINFEPPSGVSVVTPHSFAGKSFKSLWRSFGLTNQANASKLDIFHGLSNELPANAQKLKSRKVVTIHDLIFLRYPQV